MVRRIPSLDQWIDHGDFYDSLYSIEVGIIAFVLLYPCNVIFPESRMSAVYQVISSSSANILGFVAATLTIVTGFAGQLAGSFTEVTFPKLFREFQKAFCATLICYALPIYALLKPGKLIALLTAIAFAFFLCSIARTIFIVFHINKNVVAEVVERKLKEEVDENDMDT